MGIPFECNICHFRNVTGRDPVEADPRDNYTLMFICRAHFDAFWSRDTSTVTGNFGRLQKDCCDALSDLSIKHPVPVLGRNKLMDRVGMTCALITLNASLRPGKYMDHLQWDSMQKTLMWYNNTYKVSKNYGEGSIFTNQDKRSMSPRPRQPPGGLLASCKEPRVLG